MIILVFWIVYLAMGVVFLWLLDKLDSKAPQTALFSIILWPVLMISFLLRRFIR